MIKIGDSLFDEKGNAFKIVKNTADGKMLLIDLTNNRVIGELYVQHLIYSDDKTYFA